MTGLNAAALLEAFFRADNKTQFDPTSVLLAVFEVEQHVRLWADSAANVAPFVDALPVWRSEVYHYIDADNGRFGNYAASGNLSKGDIGVLSWAAERISVTAPESTPESREAVADLVKAARRLLIEDTTLPQKMRLHVTRLLRHVEEALDNFDITGDFILADAVERLIGAIQLVEVTSEAPSKWTDFKSQFLPGVAAQIASSGAVDGMAVVLAGITKALGA